HLLHWTVNHIIHPRTGSLNLFNDFHLFFLYHIIRGIQINLPLFIVKSMMAVPHNERLLPYGGIITRILKAQQIDLSIEKSIPLNPQYDFLHKATLHRMRWKKKSRIGEWARREGGDPLPPPQHEDQPGEESFESKVLAHFDNINTRFDSQNQQLATISHN